MIQKEIQLKVFYIHCIMQSIKSYTTIEQSRKLAEILPLESADMYWWSSGKRYYIEAMDDGDFNEKEGHVRAWSLAALIGVLPEIQGGKPVIALDDNYITYPHMSDLHTKADNLVDACYEMILKLHELRML